MYSNGNEYTYPLVKQKPVGGSRGHCNLNSRKSKTKFSPFTGSKCEWYRKHETLWEKFIKDHLLIGKQGFVEERTLVSKPPIKQAQHFHLDPIKCKEINIDIKTEGDKSVSISFVTSETNIHNLLPINGHKCVLNNGELTNVVEENGNPTVDRLKQNFEERNYETEKILESEKKLKDICIDTKSLECFSCLKDEKVDLDIKTFETNNDTGETKKENIKTQRTCVDLSDNDSLKSASVATLSDSKCISKTTLPTKVNQRFPPKEPTIRSQNLCTRTISSKLLFKRDSNTFSSIRKASKYIEVGHGEGQKHTTFCVHCFHVENNQKELPGQNFVKTDRCVENKINSKNCVDESLKREKSCKNLTVYSSEDKRKEDLHETSKRSLKDKSLLQINKKKSDKSNVNTEKTDNIKEYSKTKLKCKKAVTALASEKESSLGGWFGFSKTFNIFKFKKQPISKETDKKKNRKKEKKIVSDSSNTVSTDNIKRPNLKSKSKKKVYGKIVSDSSNTVSTDNIKKPKLKGRDKKKIVCDSSNTVSTVNVKKLTEKDKRKFETKIVSDSSFATSTVKLKKSNTADGNQSLSKTNMSDTCTCRNDDAGDGEQYVKYRHYSHKVRNRSHSPSKSRNKPKDAARHCNYCNRTKEKLKFLPDNVPRISDSAFFGPTLDEAILNLISCLPSNILKRIGLFHKLNPDLDRDEVTREDIVKCESNCEEGKKRSTYYEDCRDEDDVLRWLNNEYIKLASELAEAKRNPNGKMTPEMYEAREYVLNKLQEILEEKRYIQEKRERQKQKKERRRSRE